MAATHRPVIGITTWQRPSAEYPYEPAVATLASEYVDAVIDAGGLPLLISEYPSDQCAQLVALLDGLILSGGGDVDPAAYGAANAGLSSGIDETRDAFETGLLGVALDANLPTLGICRGQQIINVALGGTLVQDVKHLDAHSADPPSLNDRHDVAIAAGSWLAGVYGATAAVNSLHHQAIGVVADSLLPVATAADGVVEAVEHKDRPLCAVQWHPEKMRTDGGDTLFAAWVATLA